jgi:hypothetical protein
LLALCAVGSVGLGLLRVSSGDYLEASGSIALAAMLAIYALDILFWLDGRRPAWASSVLGAVLAFFLIALSTQILG